MPKTTCCKKQCISINYEKREIRCAKCGMRFFTNCPDCGSPLTKWATCTNAECHLHLRNERWAYVSDGSKTLIEAAEAFENAAKHLRELDAAGWTLCGEVADKGYMSFEPPADEA